MSISIHKILDKGDCYFNELKLFLEQDAVNKQDDRFQFAPLHRVLRSENCSLDRVKLLIQYGADVNLVSVLGTPLFIAILHQREKHIIEVLLAAGADVENTMETEDGEYFLPPLFLALHMGASAEIIRMLLESGSSLIDSSGRFDSVFHCSEDSELKTDVCKLLLDAGAGLNELDMFGRSVLCISLRRGADKEAIKMLLDGGCSMSACMLHDSAWLCATFCTKMLKVDVLNMLLELGVNISVDHFYSTPLECALKYGIFETSAIKLLLDLEIGDVKVPKSTMHKNLLLHAVMNSDCNLSIIELLINRGACVDVADDFGNTPLHLMVLNNNCKPKIIKLLIEKGAPVNKTNKKGKTPLNIAVETAKKLNILNLLLQAGAGIHKDMFNLLQTQYCQEELCEEEELCEIFKIFLKYAFLEDISFEARKINLINNTTFQVFLDFGTECVRELQNMHSKTIGHGCTLYQFINRFTELQIDAVNNKPQNCDLNQLLWILANNRYPLYIDVISFQIGRYLMETKLQEVQIYMVKSHPDVQSKVILNNDCICKIVRFLSNDDLLNLLLSFYILVEH